MVADTASIGELMTEGLTPEQEAVVAELSSRILQTPGHLRVITSDRGFNRLPPIPSLYGGSVRVYESSLATQAAIWLTAEAPANLNHPEGPRVEAPIHLSVEDALKLADQIRFLVVHHYHLGAA